MEATVSWWVMFLLLLNRPLSRAEWGLESNGPCSLPSSHLHWAFMPPPLEAITPSRLHPGVARAPPSAPTQPPQGLGESTAPMPCRAITLYLFLGLAREAQGRGKLRSRALGCTETLF